MLPSTPESFFQEGQQLLALGHVQRAQKAFRDAGRLCTHGGSLLEIAHALHASGDRSGAMATFRRASKYDKTLTEASERVGALLMEMGGAPAAVLVLTKAIALHPNVAILRLRLAEALGAVGRPQKALAEAQKAAELAPDSDDIKTLLSTLKATTEHTTESRKTAKIPKPPVEGKAQRSGRATIPAPSDSATNGIPIAEISSSVSRSMTSDLEEFQLPELLQLLVSQRATGNMEVYSGHSEGVIGMENGCIIYARCSGSNSLVVQLEKDQLVSSAVCKSLDSNTHDAIIAQKLQDLDLLTQDQLVSALKARIINSLKTMMGWSVGYSSFIRTASEELDSTFGIALDAQWAVFEAFRLLDEENAEQA